VCGLLGGPTRLSGQRETEKAQTAVNKTQRDLDNLHGR
jgi:hypothetical protein